MEPRKFEIPENKTDMIVNLWDAVITDENENRYGNPHPGVKRRLWSAIAKLIPAVKEKGTTWSLGLECGATKLVVRETTPEPEKAPDKPAPKKKAKK